MAPSHAAIAPARKSPSWLDVPVNSEFTALTRPRMSSGVSICTSVKRITTLTASDAPSTASAAIDSRNDVDSANTMVAMPNSATQKNMMRPICRVSGQLTSVADTATAPIAGAARNRPSPSGPVWNTSSAKIGSNAVVPPSSTANRSSEMTPRMIGECLM